MSWDIFVQRYPDSAERVAAIPVDFVAAPLGARSEVIGRLHNAFPAADFSNPSWGVLRAEDYLIEFGIGDDQLLFGLTLHVRGSEAVIPLISRVLDVLGARAIDSWTGEFFDPDMAGHSLARWNSYIEEGG